MTELEFGADAPLLHIMSSMRAMRRLKPDPVPQEILEQLITAASYGPSGGNNQAFSFVVVTDRDQMVRLVPLWQRIVRWYVTTQTPPPHMNDEAWGRFTATLEHQAEHFADTPALIVACYELSGAVGRMKSTLDKQRQGFGHLGVGGTGSFLRNSRRMLATGEAASIYPGVQNLLLMARALGLGATMTTWHVMFEKEFKDILGIPRQVHTFAAIPVGYPTGNFGAVSRRPVAGAIHWQQW